MITFQNYLIVVSQPVLRLGSFEFGVHHREMSEQTMCTTLINYSLLESGALSVWIKIESYTAGQYSPGVCYRIVFTKLVIMHRAPLYVRHSAPLPRMLLDVLSTIH